MRSSDWSSYVCSSDLTEPVSLSCHVSLAGTQRVNRGLLLSGSRGPRTVWRFRNIEGSRRLDDARQVITDKTEPSDVGGARERSEERRVGKECVSTFSSRWSSYHS